MIMNPNTTHVYVISCSTYGRVFILPLIPGIQIGMMPGWLDNIVDDAKKYKSNRSITELVFERVPHMVDTLNLHDQSPPVWERWLRVMNRITQRWTCSESTACFVYERLQTRIQMSPKYAYDLIANASQSSDLGRLLGHKDFIPEDIDELLADHVTQVNVLRAQDDASGISATWRFTDLTLSWIDFQRYLANSSTRVAECTWLPNASFSTLLE